MGIIIKYKSDFNTTFKILTTLMLISHNQTRGPGIRLKHTFDAVGNFENVSQKLDAFPRQFKNSESDPLNLRRDISLDEFFAGNIFIASNDELFHVNPVGDGIVYHVMQMGASLSEMTEFGQRQILADHQPQLGRQKLHDCTKKCSISF